MGLNACIKSESLKFKLTWIKKQEKIKKLTNKKLEDKYNRGYLPVYRIKQKNKKNFIYFNGFYLNSNH